MAESQQVHHRNDSVESNATIKSIQSAGSVSSTLSMASTASVSLGIYEELKPDIERLQRTITEKGLERYLPKAELLVSSLSSSDFNETDFCGSKLKLDGVLKGMLVHAVGVDGKKYVLAAILSCESQAQGLTDDEKRLDSVKRLKAVAETWTFYVLFIFKAGPGSHKKQLRPLRTMSRDVVLRRDGYQCVITGWLDKEHLHDRDLPAAPVVASHILRRAVATFKDGSDASRAAALTFDILRHFTGLGEKVIQNLEDHADHVANGLTLNLIAHAEWDAYAFCLKATDVEHEYKIHYFSNVTKGSLTGLRGLAHVAPDELVRFKDRSDEFQQKRRKKLNDEDGAQPSSSTRSGSGPQGSSQYELPSKTFIAIHAAVAGVLNMSGAGKFFDELLSKFDKDDKKNPPARCWDDLEVKALNSHLSESVHEMFINA
ncbi:hypothetical protein NLJ89_g7949 [Agrocybe chaxingu]|uniref:HNH nuclease domain-containing protein n=1 Tax=Agrocybe chaxingu TaxID=84603 RepID=A0A9W8JVC5_9AGAR|nr:hypothetical protein NLJ89_g7949 [Agrocybe chaxingu]